MANCVTGTPRGRSEGSPAFPRPRVEKDPAGPARAGPVGAEARWEPPAEGSGGAWPGGGRGSCGVTSRGGPAPWRIKGLSPPSGFIHNVFVVPGRRAATAEDGAAAAGEATWLRPPPEAGRTGWTGTVGARTARAFGILEQEHQHEEEETADSGRARNAAPPPPPSAPLCTTTMWLVLE